MAQKHLTDEEIEREIEELKKSPYVKLARCENRLKYKKRQALYNLRHLEKRGKQLADSGVTFESLAAQEEEIQLLDDVEG